MNKRYSVLHASRFYRDQVHEVIDAPDMREAVRGLSRFHGCKHEEGMAEFLAKLPEDLEGIKEAFQQFDEIISVVLVGEAGDDERQR